MKNQLDPVDNMTRDDRDLLDTLPIPPSIPHNDGETFLQERSPSSPSPSLSEKPHHGIVLDRSGSLSSSTKEELRKLFSLSYPIVASNILSMAIGITNMSLLGHLSADAIAAASLGYMFTNCALFFGIGILTASDTLISQAFGAGRHKYILYTLQQSLFICIIVSIPISIAYFCTEQGLLLMGQIPKIAAMSGQYARVLVIGLLPNLFYQALGKYLASQGHTRPATWVALCGFMINVLMSSILSRGFFSWEGMGFLGCALSDALVRWVMFGLMCVFVKITPLHRDATWSFSLQSFKQNVAAYTELAKYMKLGVPGALMLCCEILGFEIQTAAAGILGEIQVAAHSTLLQTCATTFMIPLGFSIACSIRVGQQLGAGDAHGAARSVKVALGMASFVMILTGIFLSIFRNSVGYAYTNDDRVVRTIASLVPIAALWQLFDGVQVVCGGALRGMGRQKVGAILNLVAYFVIGTPLGWSLAFPEKMGLTGLWLGLFAGLSVVAIIGCIILKRTNWQQQVDLAGERLKHSESSDIAALVSHDEEVEMEVKSGKLEMESVVINDHDNDQKEDAAVSRTPSRSQNHQRIGPANLFVLEDDDDEDWSTK